MAREFRVGETLEFRETENGLPEADLRILTYGVVDSYRTSFRAGVFARSVANGIMPSVWSHDATRPIGVVTEFRDDGQHLDGTLKFLDFASVPDARMAHAAMKSGAMPGISFAFERRADEADTENRGATSITDADMIEISPVLLASVPGSSVLSVRANEDTESISFVSASDLLSRLSSGEIDLAEALQRLKGIRSVVPEQTIDAVAERLAALDKKFRRSE